MNNKKIRRLLTMFIFSCLSITICMSATNTQKSKNDNKQKDKISETTEYYEMLGNSKNKRQVDKKTYEDNLVIEEEYRRTGIKKDVEVLKAEQLSNSLDIMEPQYVIEPPEFEFVDVVFKMNGSEVIANGSSVDCSSVKVTVTSSSTPITRYYRLNNSSWYGFANNTYFYDPGYYELQVSNPSISENYNFTILPGTSNEEEEDEIPDLISTRLVSRVVYHVDDQRATYSTSSIWDNPIGDPRYNVSVQVMWPSDEATAFANLSQTVNVRKYGEYTDWLGINNGSETSTIWHSSTNDEFTGVEEDVNPISDIEARTLGYDTNLPMNQYEEIYTLGTVCTKLYTYYEITLNITVQCNPVYLAQLDSTLHVFSTFTFIETQVDLSPYNYWQCFFDLILGFATFEGAVAVLAPVALANVTALVSYASLTLTVIYFIVKQYDGTTLGTDRQITHTIMSTLEV